MVYFSGVGVYCFEVSLKCLVAVAVIVCLNTKMSDVNPPFRDVYSRLFSPPEDIRRQAHCTSMEQYRAMYARSVDDPAGFWSEVANHFYWKKAPEKNKFLDYNFDPTVGAIKIKWMQDAVTNVCYNVLDRHVANGLDDKVAFFW